MSTSLSSIVRRVLLLEAISIASVKASLAQTVRDASYKGDPPSDQEVTAIVATISDMIDKLRERLLAVAGLELKGATPAKVSALADEYTSMGSQWAVREARKKIEKSSGEQDVFDKWQDEFSRAIDPVVEYYKHKKGMPPESANIMSIANETAMWRAVGSVAENDPAFGFDELTDPQGRFLFKVVHSYPSMCELGKGTSWCVAKNKEHFNSRSYNADNPLLMVTDPRSGEEYLFHFGTQQFQNSHSREATVSFIREVFESLERTSFFSDFPDTRSGIKQFELRHVKGEAVDNALDALARDAEKKKPDDNVYDMFHGVLLNPDVPYERVSELCKIQSATHYRASHYRSAAARNENPYISALATFYELDDPKTIAKGDFFRFRPNPAAYEYTLDNWSHLKLTPSYKIGVLADMVRSSSHLDAALQERLVDFFVEESRNSKKEDDAVTHLAQDPFQFITLGDVIRRLAPTPRKELSDFVTGRLGSLATKANWDGSTDPLECARIIGFYYRQADRSQLVRIQRVLDLIMNSVDKEAEKLASDISDRIVTLLHSRQSRDGRSQRDDSIMHVLQRLDSVLEEVLRLILSKWPNKKPNNTLSFSQLERRNSWIFLTGDMFLKHREIARIDAQLRAAYDRSDVKKSLAVPLSASWAGEYAQSWLKAYFLFHEGDDVQKIDETDYHLPSEGAELVKVGDSVTVRFNSRNIVEIPRPIDRSEEPER